MSLNKIKIFTVVGTRPELIKLSETIKAIDKFFVQVLINTNQNFEYELNKIFFEELKIRKPDYNFGNEKKKAIEKIADNFIKFEKICIEEKPNAILILGDTNSTLVTYVAKRYKIPIFHLEAGNRCFDQRVPEEINRKIVDHLSDINLVYSDIAKSYLLNEGLDPNKIIKVGSPILEVYEKNRIKINKSNILNKLKIKKKKYFLISFHREENLDVENKLKKFIEMLNFLNDNYKFDIIISSHYKLMDRLKTLNYKFNSKKIKFLKPFGYFDYCKLLINSYVVLSDSGTLNEEASIMKFKALNLRETHERPEADEEGTAPLVNMKPSEISNAIDIITKTKPAETVKDYLVKNFSEKVVKIILSFLRKIEREVWKKY
jgi:UDP-N-acetylglucosamine 2-epimerase (non-hydrolysing)